MSGRGRSSNFRGNRNARRGSRNYSGRNSNSGGRNNNRNNTNRGNNTKNNPTTAELKFTPHYSGKQQMVTYDAVKEHVIQQIQKNYRYGIDMAQSLRNMQYTAEPGGTRPVRQIVTMEDLKDEKMTAIKQEGYNIDYKE